MKKKYSVILLVLLSAQLLAQQLINSSYYFYKPLIYNPAFATKSSNVNAMIVHRNQWTGFNGAPQSNIFSIDSRLNGKKIGLGATFQSDKRGVNSRVGANIMYAYRIILAKDNFLSFGLSMGLFNYGINYSTLEVQDVNDPNIANGKQSAFLMSSAAGLAFINKKVEFGFSAPQLLSSKAKYKADGGGSIYYKEVPHYVNYFRYNHRLSKTRFMYLSPFYLLRFSPATPMQYDLGLLFDYKYKFWIGLVYKNQSAVSTNVGLCLYKRMAISYAFDYSIGNMAPYAGNSHEVMLNYTFGKIQMESNSLIYDSLYVEKPDLNTLLLKRLLMKADTILNSPKSTKTDCILMIAKLSEFSSSFEEDPQKQKIVGNYTEKLTERIKQIDEINITYKGQILLPAEKNKKQKADYTDISILLFEKDSGAEIGSFVPKPKNGKFIIAIKPNDKCYLQIEKPGFQTYLKELKTTDKKKSYEVELLVKLKKIKKVPSK
jgi:type IX secretion system PorP/SprF family membrane protein